MKDSKYQVTVTIELDAADSSEATGVVEDVLLDAGLEEYEVESSNRINGPNPNSAIDFDENEESQMLNEGRLS